MPVGARRGDLPARCLQVRLQSSKESSSGGMYLKRIVLELQCEGGLFGKKLYSTCRARTTTLHDLAKLVLPVGRTSRRCGATGGGRYVLISHTVDNLDSDENHSLRGKGASSKAATGGGKGASSKAARGGGKGAGKSGDAGGDDMSDFKKEMRRGRFGRAWYKPQPTATQPTFVKSL